ncbi:MAG: prepilin peptidase [Chloroflexi bacterium]|nr:prepilin peptidase [Chloroflexota bacterium]
MDWLLAFKLIVTAWLATVTLWDLRTGRIPNWLTLIPALGIGIWQLTQGVWFVPLIWVALFMIWRLGFIGGGDIKFLMGLFALFPTEHFFLRLAIMVIIISLPYLVWKYWGQHPLRLVRALLARLASNEVLPTREEFQIQARRFVFTWTIPGAIYLWFMWQGFSGAG